MQDVLLILILVALVVIGVLLNRICQNLIRWNRVWENSPAFASDYHAKETLKVVQEIAHYLAVDHLERKSQTGA